MNFCYLEDEIKAYQIIKNYNQIYENDQASNFQDYDNRLQIDEINVHLNLNHLEHNESEKIYWILHYGKDFRIYLNTLKILFLVLRAKGVEIEEMSFEEFCVHKQVINQNSRVLEIIHA